MSDVEQLKEHHRRRGPDPIQFNVTVVDQAGNPITKPLVVRVDAGLSGTVRNVNPANFYYGPPLQAAWVGDVEVIADGYAPWTTGANPQITFHQNTVNVTATLVPSFKRPPSPVPVPRGPLPPFPEPIDYRTELPYVPPPIPTRDFYRGDAWGVVVPGAPWVPGASSRHPERILSWFVDRYTPEFQQQYLELYGGYGYTHFALSYADSCGPVDNGPNSPPGNAQSLEQFIETCLRVKRYVPYAHVMIGSKYFQPMNMTPQQWADFADPIMLALFEANAADEIVLGWEWNLWNVPGDTTIKAFKHAGQLCHAHGRSFWMHYSPHVTSWFADGDSRGRFGFYDDIAPDVDGIDYQSQPEWSNAETQARIVDSLWQFGERGNDVLFRFWEDQAVMMFDNTSPVYGNRCNQPGVDGLDYVEYANQRGYLACCTIDDVKHTDAVVWGYGNGGRLPSGERL